MNGYPRTTENGTPNGTPRMPGQSANPFASPGPMSQPPQQARPTNGLGAPMNRQPPMAPPPQQPQQPARAGARAAPPPVQQPPQQTRQAPAQQPQRSAPPVQTQELILVTVTPPFILSFSSLFEKSMFADKWAYRAQMNFDKRLVDLTRPAAGQKVSILDVVRNACIKAWGEDSNRWPRNFNDPILDGDEKLTGEGEISNPGYYYVRATTPNQPGVYDRHLNPIIDPDNIYPGCICRAEVYAAAYDRNGNQGVKLYLNKIQKIADGEPLIVRTRAEDVFLNNEDLDATAYGGFVHSNPPNDSVFGYHHDYGNGAP